MEKCKECGAEVDKVCETCGGCDAHCKCNKAEETPAAEAPAEEAAAPSEAPAESEAEKPAEEPAEKPAEEAPSEEAS